MLLLLAVATRLPAQSLEEFLTTAETLQEEQRYQDALVMVERGLERFPGNVRLSLRHASLEDHRGDRIRAIGELMYLRDRNPDNDTVLYAIGNMFLYSGMLDSAMLCYEQLLGLAHTPADSFAAYLNIGSVYNYQQDTQAGIRHYEFMRQKFGDSVSVLNNLADAYRQAGRTREAIALLEESVRLNPELTEPYNNLGMLYTDVSAYDKAELYFKKALKLEPESAVVMNNYGYLLYKMNQPQQALKYINQSIARYGTNPYAYRNRALVYLLLNLQREACADLKASKELGFAIYYGAEVDNLIEEQKCN